MKGFVLKSLTDKGVFALNENLSANKKFFRITKLCEEPLEIKFEIKNPALKRFFSVLPSKDMVKHISSKLDEYGVVENEDYKVQVLI